jgi:hypothetical protein
MTLLRQIASEIYSMFAGDAAMSVFIVMIVAAAAGLRFLTPLPSPLIGIGLMMGCLTLLIARVVAHARRVRR